MSDQIDTNWRYPRRIVERVVVTGDLRLQTPAHFGSGDADPWQYTSMILLRDPLTGQALLPGASIAGALRNYLRELELGYDEKSSPEEMRTTKTVALFGGSKGDDQGAQSALIVDDALAEINYIELRDGVKIDPATRTAKEDALFDMELLPAGTTFKLRFELLITEGQKERLLEALVMALQGLEPPGSHSNGVEIGPGRITLGARKRRGFGQCAVEQWQVTRFDLTDPVDLVSWLEETKAALPFSRPIAEALGIKPTPAVDKREYFALEATFALDSPLLINSSSGLGGAGADATHLHVTVVKADGSTEMRPIVPGSSWAGVIRHRALKIARSLAGENTAFALVRGMFGNDKDKAKQEELTASRVSVQDSPIQGVTSGVQSRIKIDRFTGGAYETALFNEQPIFSTRQNSRLSLKLALRNPQESEIGLLLLVLKDLWTGDLAVGGSSSIGRGRLQGLKANFTLHRPGQNGLSQTWHIERAKTGQLTVQDPTSLQEFVDQMHRHLGGAL